jgi:hypothetical protein
LFSGHEYGKLVFTAVEELETEVADLDDVPELELVPVVAEVPTELELVPTVDEVPEELAEFVRLEVVLLVTELELEFELEFFGGPAEKTTAPAG